MAFNPFHSFRKYRKAMFAILAIVCMFTFVLSSGLGGRNDILNVLPEWLGGGGSKYPVVARIDGKRIDELTIIDTRVRRKMANDYMSAMFDEAARQFMDRARTRIKDEDLLTRRLQTIAIEKVVAAQMHSGIRYGQMQQQQRGMPVPPERALKEHIDDLSAQIEQMKAKKKTEEAEYLTSLRSLLEQDKGRLRALPTMGLFFGGSVQTADDVLDFLVWKWEADRQKIDLTPEAVLKLIKQETLGEDLTLYSDNVVEFLKKQKYRNFKTEILLDALTDEFRVRIVQARMLGESGSLTADPAVLTPYEQRKHLSDECKSVRTVLLPIDVNPFLAQVTATPSEQELKDLYEKHKKDEFNPRLDRPGFMEPKKVKLEWISGKPDSAYFRKLGQETAAKESVQIAVSSVAAPGLSGVVPAASWIRWLDATKFDDIPESRVQREYEKYTKNEKLNINSNPNNSWVHSALVFFNVHDSSKVGPRNYAATIADMLTANATGGPVFAPAVTLNTMAITQEMRQRIRFGLQM